MAGAFESQLRRALLGRSNDLTPVERRVAAEAPAELPVIVREMPPLIVAETPRPSWRFTIRRDDDGLIAEVIATPLEN